MVERTSAIDETSWEVDRWSPITSLIPTFMIVLGTAVLLFGLYGLLFPWEQTSRGGFLLAIAWALACAWFGARRLFFAARWVTMSTDGTFTFRSRRAVLVVAPGELSRIRSDIPLDWWCQYLCRIYARRGTMLVCQRLRRTVLSHAQALRDDYGSSLVSALAEANPDAILDKAFTRGVGPGPFFGP